jgi:CRP-like cAMP-binding protein
MAAPFPTPTKLWYLKNIRLFEDLSPLELQDMERITRMENVRKHQPLYLPGEPSHNVYLLKKGRVKLTNSALSGKEITFEILEPGEVFGELEVLEGSFRATAAEALDDVVICLIRREDFDRYLATHPSAAVRLTKLIGLRLRRIQSRIEDLVFRDVPARLAHLLIELSKDHGAVDQRGVRLRAKLTHQEMANLIGCSRETVSHTLGQFREDGLIQMDGHSIIIIDDKGLSNLHG